MTANEVRYRENAASCNVEPSPAGQEAPFAAAAMSASSAMSSVWSSEATALPTTGYSASSEPTTTTSMTYDDGSYHWSAPPPAITPAGAQAVWKRQSMMQGDPFLLSTPLAPSMTLAAQVTSTSVVESSSSGPSPYWSSTSSTWSTPTPSINSADPGSTELAAPISQATQDCSIGFIGLFFSTFFGGHTADWSPSSDQYTYFKEFQMWINA
jgi:hypothetical protein